MAAARLAPELSATSKIDRIWSIKSGAGGVGGVGGGGAHGFRVAFHDLHQSPAFGLGERTCFLDAHAVTRPGLALFVVGVEFLVLRDDLLELRMGKAALDAHDDRSEEHT